MKKYNKYCQKGHVYDHHSLLLPAGWSARLVAHVILEYLGQVQVLSGFVFQLKVWL